MEPPGPAFGRPDDKLSVIRGRPVPDYAALHPGYKRARRGNRSKIGLRIHDRKMMRSAASGRHALRAFRLRCHAGHIFRFTSSEYARLTSMVTLMASGARDRGACGPRACAPIAKVLPSRARFPALTCVLDRPVVVIGLGRTRQQHGGKNGGRRQSGELTH